MSNEMKIQRFEMYNRPEDAGVSSKGLLEFLKAAQKSSKTVQFHSMIILRHGKVVGHFNWAPYDSQTPHKLFSLSKSFTSAAAGFAVHEGLLQWNSSVVDILPDEIPTGREDELRPVTLETLLSMGSGLDEASDSPSPDPAVTWARHVLSHNVKYAPMTHFHYNTFGTYLVSCMVQKVTGMTVRDYLMPRLFEPLGIEKPEWDSSPQGISCGGFGLHLKTEDIACFGQCLLQHGQWNGKQVLPEGWVERATAEHIANYKDQREDGNEWGQGYGYQFWRCIDGRYRGDGAFGQVCMVDEARDAVIAITCGTNDMGAEFKLLRDFVFPAFDAETSSEADQKKLLKKVEGLRYDFVTDDASDTRLPEGEFVTEFSGMECGLQLKKKKLDLISLTMRFGDAEWDRFEMILPRGKPALVCYNPGQKIRHFGCYGWNKGTLWVDVRSPDGPDTMKGKLVFRKDQLIFEGIGIDCPNGKIVFKKKIVD